MIPTGLFISPDNGEALFWHEDRQVLETLDGQYRYALKAGVLQLLVTPKTEGAAFNYAEHYQQDAEEFDYFAGWEDPAAVHENRRLHEMILSKAPAKSSMRVLDVGCGAAWVAAHFVQAPAHSVFSLDISNVNPQKAVARYPSDNHIGVVADVFHLPFAEASFDFVIASEIIEHVPDPAGFLRCLLKVLAPGGRLVVTTPHDEKLAYSLCIHCNKATPHHAHLHSFTEDSIRQLLPTPVRTNARTLVFMNKVLLHGRTHPVMRYLPFPIWQFIDRMATFFVPKAARLLVLVER